MLRILFVDDEPKLLEGLKRTLRPLRREWNCGFANGGTQALQLLDENPFDVVITDMRMPVMDGLQLLEQVKTRHPRLRRIVLSGQSEREQFIQSSGISHRYLAKPCGLENLKLAVTQEIFLRTPTPPAESYERLSLAREPVAGKR